MRLISNDVLQGGGGRPLGTKPRDEAAMTTPEYLISLPCGSSKTCHPHQLRSTVHCPPSSYHSPKRSVKMATCTLRTMLLSVLMMVLVLSRMTSALVVPLNEHGECPIHTVRTLDGNNCMSCSSCYSDYSPQDWLCMNCTQGKALSKIKNVICSV